MLDELDVEVVGEARNGVEALRMVGERRHDVLMLDIAMPEVDGFDVARHLTDPRPLIVFQTAYDEHALEASEHQAAARWRAEAVAKARWAWLVGLAGSWRSRSTKTRPVERPQLGGKKHAASGGAAKASGLARNVRVFGVQAAHGLCPRVVSGSFPGPRKRNRRCPWPRPLGDSGSSRPDGPESHFHVSSIAKKWSNTARVGLLRASTSGLRM